MDVNRDREGEYGDMKKLNKKQLKAIELLIEGGYTQQEIADIVGVTRQTLHNWRTNNDTFIGVYKDRIKLNEEIVTDKFSEKMGVVASTIFDIITDEDVDKGTRLRASTYWLDRALGTPSSQVNLRNVINVESEVDEEDILDVFDDIDG